MKEIPLTQNKIAIVDDKDFEELSKHKWCINKSKSYVYAARRVRINGMTKLFKMHREILKLSYKDGKIVDHINHNGLDNRKCNLRLVDKSLNGYNCKKYINNPSGYRGVTKRKNKWRAAIRINGKLKHLGSFSSVRDAALAYDCAVSLYRIQNAPLNFPQGVNHV
jgi:hypothetical protein